MATIDDTIQQDVEKLLAATIQQLSGTSSSSGPISSDALKVTTVSGFGAFGTAAAGAATAIIAAAKGQSSSIIIAALAFAAIALFAIVLLVRSDHKARASVYVALENSLPALVTAATRNASSSDTTVGASSSTSTETAKSAATAYVIPVHDQVRVKLTTTGDEVFDVLAIRVDIDPSTPWGPSSAPSPWYLTGQIGGDAPMWRQSEVGPLAAAPTGT